MNEPAYPQDTHAQVRYPKGSFGAGPTSAAAGSADCTWAQADLQDADQPVSYTLTVKAEALLAYQADTAARPGPEAG